MKNYITRGVSALLCVAAVVTAASCGVNDKLSLAPTKADREVVMTVGGREVQYQEFRYYFLNNKRDKYGADASLTAEQTAELVALTEDNARNRYALLLLAEKYGTGVTDADIAEADAYVENYRTNYFENDEDYALALEANYMTDWLFRSLQSENMLAYSVLNKMKEAGDIKTDDATVDAAFAGDGILCIKEIYVNKSNYDSDEAAHERAEEAQSKLMEGVPFEEVMIEYSDYDKVSLPPEHGYYTMKYDALDVIWDTASRLAEGEHSYVIESEYGYHIVMRCEKDFEYMNSIRDSIVENYTYAKFGEIFYPFAETLEVSYSEYGESLDFSVIS